MNSSEILRFQEKRLRTKAEQSGSFRDLLFFYFYRHDREAIDALEEEIPHDSRDRIYLEVARLDSNPEKAPGILEAARSVDDPWVFYTVAKHFLKSSGVTEALRCVAASLEHNPHNITTLNLLIRYFSYCNEAEMVRRLAANSLAIAPKQEDIQRLCAGGHCDELYLEAFPKRYSLTFYVPVYNVERYILMALEGVFSLNYPLDDVIVVDDGTQDDSIEIARGFPVTILKHSQNRGLAAARNTALRHCTTQLIGSVDTDARPDVDYVHHVALELENGDKNTAGVGGRLIENRQDTPADRWRALAMPQHWGDKRICSPEFLFGSNGIYYREAILNVGGYDEQFRTNAEDTHLSQTLRQAGYHLVYLPWAKVYHERTDSVPSVLRTVWNWYFSMKSEQGVYSDGNRLCQMAQLTLQQGLQSIEHLKQAGLTDLIYIQFAYVVHELIRDVQYAMDTGILDTDTVVSFVSALLNAVETVDRRFGGELAVRLRNDLHETVNFVLPTCRGKPSLHVGLEMVLGEFERFCQTITRELYHQLTA